MSDASIDPFEVVARALGCSSEALSIESRIYKDHGWDSFGHVRVIMALERAYGIGISDDETMKLTTMRGIVEFTKDREAADST